MSAAVLQPHKLLLSMPSERLLYQAVCLPCAEGTQAQVVASNEVSSSMRDRDPPGAAPRLALLCCACTDLLMQQCACIAPAVLQCTRSSSHSSALDLSNSRTSALQAPAGLAATPFTPDMCISCSVLARAQLQVGHQRGLQPRALRPALPATAPAGGGLRGDCRCQAPQVHLSGVMHAVGCVHACMHKRQSNEKSRCAMHTLGWHTTQDRRHHVAAAPAGGIVHGE